MVDLLGDRPVADFDRGQPRLVVLEALALPLHRLGGVVGHAVVDLRLLEDAELFEELQQVGVGVGFSLFGGWRRRAAGDCQRHRGEKKGELAHGGSFDGRVERGLVGTWPGYSSPRLMIDRAYA